MTSSGRQAPSAGRKDLLRADGAFLASDLATAGMGSWISARFLFEGGAPWKAGLVGALVWAVAGVILTVAYEPRVHSPARRLVIRALGWMAIGLVLQLQFSGGNWKKAFATAVALGVTAALVRWLARVGAGGRGIGFADGLRCAGLQAIAAWAVQPYIGRALVGSGDAYHYCLMLGDMVAQVRAGVFPVFVGQSIYAFNGNVHTLRTAPYFEHLGAALDLLSVHTLPFYSLENASVLVSTGLGAVGGYAALRLYCPGRPWSAAALAALNVLSPGVLAPLYGGDMIATFMTVPFLPWLMLGLARGADSPLAWKPWILQATALAALWWAHPPVAIWATLLTMGAGVWVLAAPGSRWPRLLRMVTAAFVCAVLATYVVVSVRTLDLEGASQASRQDELAGIARSVSKSWGASLRPVSLEGASSLGNLQLGYSLIAGLLTGLLTMRTRPSARMLLSAAILFLVLLWPPAGTNSWLWSYVPGPVLQVTNQWPMQRFYIILASLAAFVALAGLSRLNPQTGRTQLALGVAVAVALGWSFVEARKFVGHALRTMSTSSLTEQAFREENVRLTRSSYLIFNFFPSYFSHGAMSPALESRLCDPDTCEPYASGATPRRGWAPAVTAAADLRRNGSIGRIEPGVPLAAASTTLLHFDFLGNTPEGVLQLEGKTLFREYQLPSSGGVRSFGAGPSNSRIIAIQNTAAEPDLMQADFVQEPGNHPALSEPVAHIAYDSLGSRPRVLEVKSLIPLAYSLHSEKAALLETPRVFIPGYKAWVNGHAAAPFRTREGLTGIAVPAGDSEVRLEYTGCALLHLTYWLSLGGWVTCMALVLASPIGRPKIGIIGPSPAEQAAIRWLRRLTLPVLAAAVATMAVALGWIPRKSASGPVGMELLIPWGHLGQSEPLFTTGKTGAADVIFITYLPDSRVEVGRDKWSYGGKVSAPFRVDRTVPQVVEISRATQPSPFPDRKKVGFSVRWNGQLVLSDDAIPYPANAKDAAYGANPVGASSCGPLFTGKILRVWNP